jgi:hypothetical protein
MVIARHRLTRAPYLVNVAFGRIDNPHDQRRQGVKCSFLLRFEIIPVVNFPDAGK